MRLKKNTRNVSVAVAAALTITMLAGCGGSDEQQPRQQASDPAQQPKPVTQKQMHKAIESMVEGIEGTDDCRGERIVGNSLLDPDSERDQLWKPRPTEWLGPDRDPKAAGARPEFVGRVLFCAGEDKGDASPSKYLLHVHGFESDAVARSWFEELKTEADDGLELDTTGDDNPHYISAGGTPPTVEANCQPVGTQRPAEFGAGQGEQLAGAIDLVMEYPCVREDADTGQFDWDPTTLATVVSGPWVASLEVTRSTGSVEYEAPDEEGAVYTSYKTIKVQRDEQAAALTSLLRELPRTQIGN